MMAVCYIIGVLCTVLTSSLVSSEDRNVPDGLTQLLKENFVADVADIPFPDDIVFTLPIGGEQLTIEAHKTQLLAPGFVHATLEFDASGNIHTVPDTAYPTDCYYHGSLKGQPGTIVAVDVCSGGLHGVVHTRDKAYTLAPTPAPPTATNTDHNTPNTTDDSDTVANPSFASALARGVVAVDASIERRRVEGGSLHDDSNADNQDSGAPLDGPSPSPSPASATSATGTVAHASHDSSSSVAASSSTATTPLVTATGVPVAEVPSYSPSSARPARHIELMLFSDSARLRSHGTHVAAHSLRLANAMAAYYRAAATKHDLRVVVKGHYSFTSDPYPTTHTADGATALWGTSGLLKRFMHFSSTRGTALPSRDLTFLLSGRTFEEDVRGLAHVGGVCEAAEIAGGIAQVTYESAVLNAVLLGHEMMHVLGLSHDTHAPGTACAAQDHLMGPHVSENTRLSPCSRAVLNEYLDTRTCLLNDPFATETVDVDVTIAGATTVTDNGATVHDGAAKGGIIVGDDGEDADYDKFDEYDDNTDDNDDDGGDATYTDADVSLMLLVCALVLLMAVTATAVCTRALVLRKMRRAAAAAAAAKQTDGDTEADVEAEAGLGAEGSLVGGAHSGASTETGVGAGVEDPATPPPQYASHQHAHQHAPEYGYGYGYADGYGYGYGYDAAAAPATAPVLVRSDGQSDGVACDRTPPYAPYPHPHA